MKKNIQKKALRLVFDARMIQHSGIGIYIRNLLRSFRPEHNLELRVLGTAEKILHEVPGLQAKIDHFDAPIYSIREQRKYPAIDAAEILHVPHYNAPLPYLRSSVVTIHDLIHLKSREFILPHYRLYSYSLLRWIAKRARHILTISETTRSDFLSYFPAAADKVTAIPNGFFADAFLLPQKASRIRAFQEERRLAPQYLLHVGIAKKHKNVDFLIRAFAPEWRSGRLSLPLVLAGCGGTIPPYVMKYVKRFQVEEYVRAMPYLSRTELTLLYRGAKVFVYPSLWEGFGYPLLEAMACGAPVLCSNASVLPETCGDAALYFHPHKEAALRKALYRLLGDHALRRRLSSYGKSYVKRYNWPQHIRKLVRLYRKAAKVDEDESTR